MDEKKRTNLLSGEFLQANLIKKADQRNLITRGREKKNRRLLLGRAGPRGQTQKIPREKEKFDAVTPSVNP